MHDDICKVVSERFYNNMLITPASVKEARRLAERTPLIWVSVRGQETVPAKSKSYVNYEEVNVIRGVVDRLRTKHPKASIAVLTFYKGQLKELMEAVESSLNIEVLTVDSCQGSEFDYVVLSTVRANRMGSIGFVKDKQRINVAISRSINGLVVVGDDSTLTSDEDWRAVRNACKLQVPAEWQATRPLPAVGTFESVMDALRGLKEQKRDAAAAADAVRLMQAQPSFRSNSNFDNKRDSGRNNNNSSRGAPAPRHTVIGAGGPKSGMVRGSTKFGGSGGGMDSGGGFNKGGRKGQRGGGRQWEDESVQSENFAVNMSTPKIQNEREFPDLWSGVLSGKESVKQRACYAHGMFGCPHCSQQQGQGSSSNNSHNSTSKPGRHTHQQEQNARSTDSSYDNTHVDYSSRNDSSYGSSRNDSYMYGSSQASALHASHTQPGWNVPIMKTPVSYSAVAREDLTSGHASMRTSSQNSTSASSRSSSTAARPENLGVSGLSRMNYRPSASAGSSNSDRPYSSAGSNHSDRHSASASSNNSDRAPSYAGSNNNSGRMRIDQAAASRMICHGIGVRAPRSNNSSEFNSDGDFGGGQIASSEDDFWGEPAAARIRHTRGDGLYVCGECGIAGDGLEEDNDNPGTYYCLQCWEVCVRVVCGVCCCDACMRLCVCVRVLVGVRSCFVRCTI
jgi:hypothetical protein